MVTDKLDVAWDAGDGAAFAAGFTIDADVINVFGTHIHDRSDLARQMQRIFGSTMRGSKHRTRTVEMARYLGQDTILAVSSGVIDVPTGPAAPEVNNRQTLVLVKVENVWQIRHWHNTPVRPEPRGPAEQGAAANAAKPRG